MLRVRLLFAALILVPLFMLVWADVRVTPQWPGLWLYALALLIWILAAGELRGMIRPDGHVPSRLSVFGSTLLVGLGAGVRVLWNVAGEYPPNCPVGQFGWPLLGLAAAVALSFSVEMYRFRGTETRAAARVAWSVFIAAYLGIPLAFLIALRLLGDSSHGMFALLSLLAIVKMSDTGAYAMGRMIGRHPLSPQLSPKKTVEGAVGGILAAMLTALFFRDVLGPWFLGGQSIGGSYVGWTAYSVLLALAALLGDLAESLLKRDMGCKDSSRWMAGLGGLLDVLDSVLFTAPVAYMCWVSGLVGGH